ncbi:MAG: hypothetical protein R2882_15565 [Gemmatimonadales bacterium]
MTSPSRFPAADLTSLRSRVDQLESERRRLLIVIELLRELSGSLDYRDIVHAVARRVGYALELDRCSVFLTEKGRGTCIWSPRTRTPAQEPARGPGRLPEPGAPSRAATS